MKINLDGNEWYIILEWLLEINYDLEGILNWIIIEEIIVINPIKIIEKIKVVESKPLLLLLLISINISWKKLEDSLGNKDSIKDKNTWSKLSIGK